MPELVEFVECPYNRSHRIMPHVMPKHLFKCRKNYPSVKLANCPFNTVHQIPFPEMKLHTETCPDRASFELYKYCISNFPSNRTKTNRELKSRLIYPDQGKHAQQERSRDSVPELVYHNAAPSKMTGKTLLDDDECWDDCNVPAYNPQEYCKNAKVIRKATLMKPSEKKEFYRDERRRFKEIDRQLEKKSQLADEDLNHIVSSFSRKVKIN
ncbi:gametocyte-specific factor 1 homolog [Malaya genurostris]|uniref:gametocyte-specific factor 1 homolog n=1 Tax=Malaya genurostris TaxID=325434 RepID=UPI0026F3F9BF|nr:gametocyte-specific factor 1 homolog [Malaya genurostris]